MELLDLLHFDDNTVVFVIDKNVAFIAVIGGTPHRDEMVFLPSTPNDLVDKVKDSLHISGNLKKHDVFLCDSYKNLMIQFLKDSDSTTKYKKILSDGIVNCPIPCNSFHENMFITDTDFDGILDMPIEMITSLDVLGNLID